MQTTIHADLLSTPAGREADDILRRCVHCGFCNATCPTYQLLGDELDGPRGRIYLVKKFLEGEGDAAVMQRHLDRCLTCRSCETTCPSGVPYARLADIGRELVESKVSRPFHERLLRAVLRAVLLHRKRFDMLLAMGRVLRPLLPSGLRDRIPVRVAPGEWPAPTHARRMLAFDGCVQAALSPRTNAATARVLDAVGVSLIYDPLKQCCGAIDWHLGEHDAARARMRGNMDGWTQSLDRGAEGIVITASGCAAMVQDYPHIFADDPIYGPRAARIAAAIRDPAELLSTADFSNRIPAARRARIAFHAPCTLTHALKLANRPAEILAAAGFGLTPVRDAHLCCGSAGTYSILQPNLASKLRNAKLESLTAGEPEVIATANIGCQTHLACTSPIPVRHWIEVLDHGMFG